MVKRREAKTFIERLYCKYCESELIRNTTMALTSYPAQYLYSCKNCEHNETSTEVYPKTVYEEIHVDDPRW